MGSKHEIILRNALYVLNGIEGFSDYYIDYTKQHKIENPSDIFNLLGLFKKHLHDKGRLGEEENIIISHVKEISEKVKYQNSLSKLSITSDHLKPNEDFISSFLNDYKSTQTDDLFFKEVRPRRYKTITENIALYGVDGEALFKLYQKYKDYNHPFIFYLISEPLINSKNYSQGISILEKSLKYAFRYPNIYWNSSHGIEGCLWSLFNIQYLLKKNGIYKVGEQLPSFPIKLLKLIYLYLSRYIYSNPDNPKIIDCYSHRARLTKDYLSEFVCIFGLGVNPEIQSISDYYLGYQAAMNFNLLAPPFLDLMWESMKLYRHGSHIPNSSGGYQEIEDRTWMELVQAGEIRSIHFAELFLTEFENYNYNLMNDEIEYVCNYAKEINKDDFENYISTLKKQ